MIARKLGANPSTPIIATFRGQWKTSKPGIIIIPHLYEIQVSFKLKEILMMESLIHFGLSDYK